MYPPRNVHKSKKGSHNTCTALKEYVSSLEHSQFQKRIAQNYTEVELSMHPPRNIRKSKKGTHNAHALKTGQLHNTKCLKEYVSSQECSQAQKRFTQELYCIEVKKSTYPSRNVRKSKKGLRNSCTALKSKSIPILPETFTNPKKVHTTVALH